jgi:hypothetical protein
VLSALYVVVREMLAKEITLRSIEINQCFLLRVWRYLRC